MKISLNLIIASLFIIQAAQSHGGPVIDIERLRSSGRNWTIVDSALAESGGSITMHNERWMMYFLHWRPLTEERSNIHERYVRDALLSFWGPNMPFVLREEGGETTVGGHRAFYAEAQLANGVVRTRFVIWNCRESGRQFIADCNVNLEKKTPDMFFQMQVNDITRSIECHRGGTSRKSTILVQSYSSARYKLSMALPAEWHIDEFRHPRWYPSGLTDINGSLWALTTDSEQFLRLDRYESEGSSKEEILRRFLSRLGSESIRLHGSTSRITNVIPEHSTSTGISHQTDGTLFITSQRGEKELRLPFRFRVLIWQAGESDFALLVASASLNSFWGIPVDLTPSDQTFDNLFYKEVLPHISNTAGLQE